VRREWLIAANVRDWSTIKAIRFDAGPTIVRPHAAATYTWTMSVPSMQADGRPFTGGESAWNKVAFYAESVVGGVLTPLLPTEAPWVKVRVLVPVVTGTLPG
jgi:hypothetical protein